MKTKLLLLLLFGGTILFAQSGTLPVASCGVNALNQLVINGVVISTLSIPGLLTAGSLKISGAPQPDGIAVYSSGILSSTGINALPAGNGSSGLPEFEQCNVPANPTMASQSATASCSVITKTTLDMTKVSLSVLPVSDPGTPFSWVVVKTGPNSAQVRVRNNTDSPANLASISWVVSVR